MLGVIELLRGNGYKLNLWGIVVSVKIVSSNQAWTRPTSVSASMSPLFQNPGYFQVPFSLLLADFRVATYSLHSLLVL